MLDVAGSLRMVINWLDHSGKDMQNGLLLDLQVIK